MMAIPVLGYPSITAAAVALRAEDLSDAEIGEAVGRTPSQVSSLLYYHDHRPDRVTHAIRVPAPIREAARARGMSPGDLAQRILTAVARDDLIGAVLDE